MSSKINIFIRNLHQFLRMSSILGLSFLLWNCQERDSFSENTEVPEGMQKITFLIPDYEGGAAQFGTRVFDVGEEGYMSNLYVVAVKYKEYAYVAEKDETGNTIYKRDINNDKDLSQDPQVYTFALNPVGTPFKVGENKYHSFNVTLYPGEYKFGVIANADLYLSRATNIAEFTKESQLQDIILNFKENTPLAPTHLPMVCMPEKIQYGTNSSSKKPVSSENNYVVPVTKDNNVNIYADMTFLCSKVRYTLMFDKTEGGISEGFGSAWIRFNVDDKVKPWATNIRQQTQLVWGESKGEYTDDSGTYYTYNPDQAFISSSGVNDEPYGLWTIGIDRYYWDAEEEFVGRDTDITGHTFEGKDYPKTYKSELIPWDGTTDEWIPRERKIWQGVVYLPENTGEIVGIDGITKTPIAKTVLKFPYHMRANSDDDTPEEQANNPKVISLFGNLNEEQFDKTDDNGGYIKSEPQVAFQGLERNFMYDVVARIVNPESDMDIQVFVSVIPWHEIDQNFSEDWGSSNNNDAGQDSDLNAQAQDWQYNGSESTM